MAFSAVFDASSSTAAAVHGHHGTEEDDVLLVKLKEAINQDNPAAVMCIKTVIRDSSEEQWERLYNQLEGRHQAYIQLKTQQNSDELHQLQVLVRRNLATERRLLDEQLANHRSAFSSGGDGCGVSGTDGRALHDETATTWNKAGPVAGLSASSLGDWLSTESHHHQQQHQHSQQSSAAPSASSDEAAALRATLAQRDHELALTQDRLARSRRQCHALLGRLTAAEAELQYLRNQRLSRGGGRSASLSLEPAAAAAAGCATAADIDDYGADSAASLRRSLAKLERSQLIDTADALELPGDPADVERRYDCLQVERREVEAALTRVPGQGSLHHSWHSARDRELLEKKLDNIDRELVHLRNSLKQFQLI